MHRWAQEAAKSMLTYAIEAGRLLLEVKAGLPHGGFQPWCEANLSFSYRRAAEYMRLAKSAEVRTFDPDASVDAALKAIAEKPPEAPKILDASTAEKLAKLARMANSENENEAGVAQEMIDRIGKRFGLTGEEAQADICTAAIDFTSNF